MANYVWCEDSKSGYQFWKALFKETHPDFITETQLNNSRLAKKAGKITDDGNTYYIIIDTAVDNADVLREMARLNRNIAGKNNIKLIKVHSFEFTLLSFEHLDNWLFAENDEFKDRRSKLLIARAQFVSLINNGGSTDELNKFKSVYDFSDKNNTEKIAAKLLYEITRNTGFETDKSKIGDCFVNDCCEWNDRQANDVCGLDKNKLTASEKMEQIIRHSILNAAFKEVNLL